MVKVKASITLDGKLWKHFQITAIEVYGTKRGAISQALERAIEEWIVRNSSDK